MNRSTARDISMHVGYGDLRCSIVAEGVSWSPDVADDMITRMQQLWQNTLTTSWEYEMTAVDEDDPLYLVSDEDGDD